MSKDFAIYKIQKPDEISIDGIKDYIGRCSSQVRGVLPKDNEKLFNRLSKEAYGKTASRVMEYVPVVIPVDRVNVFPFNKRFSFYKNNNYYTNLRNMMKSGYKLEDIIHFIDFSDYSTIKIIAPLFVINQLITHTQITSVMHSNRYTQSKYGYWYPDQFDTFYVGNGNLQNAWTAIVRKSTPDDLQAFMKDTLGIKRREIHARGSDMLEFREVILGGYTNDPLAWEWFIDQRTKDKHTQKETSDTVNKIKGTIYV